MKKRAPVLVYISQDQEHQLWRNGIISVKPKYSQTEYIIQII